MKGFVKPLAGFVAIGTAGLTAAAMAVGEPMNVIGFINGMIVIAGTFMSGWINLSERYNDD